MTKTNSTASVVLSKPEKPSPDFPLFPHATKRWAKKIHGRMYYFGPWDDPAGALENYKRQAEELHAGRTPKTPGQEVSRGVTIEALGVRFLAAKQDRVDSGELSQRTMIDHKATVKLIADTFGKRRLVEDLGSDDFENLRRAMTKKWGHVRVGNEVNRVRGVFKFGFESGLYSQPVRFGPTFKRPSRKTLRIASAKSRAKHGLKMFEPAELRRIIDAAGVPLKAMILLGINCGYGNADCGRLPQGALDLDRGWVTYAREKTGIDRSCPLWPETVQAIREALAQRPEPKEPGLEDRVFITQRGLSWHKEHKNTIDNPISKEMRKLLDQLGINGARNFYALRHTFETIGGDTGDQVAVGAVMGHADASMAAHYRERIDPARLKRVTDHVRAWMLGEKNSGQV